VAFGRWPAGQLPTVCKPACGTVRDFVLVLADAGLVLVGWVPAFEFINTQIMHRLRPELAFEPAS